MALDFPPYADGDGDVEPYAGAANTQYTQDASEGGRSTKMPCAIPGDQLHSPDGPYPQPATSVEPYADKGSDMTARREDSRLAGDVNTARGQRDTSNPHAKVAMTNDSSLDVPGDITPYANEARTCAARRDADGL